MVHSDKSTSVKILSRKTFSSVGKDFYWRALATMKKFIDLKNPLVTFENSQTIGNINCFIFCI